MAIAEYRLGLERIRGCWEGDEVIVPGRFFMAFGRGSVPGPDPLAYPTVAENRCVLNRVRGRTLAQLIGLSDATLNEPPELAHPLCESKDEMLGWCTRHEMFHSGQVALLRRLFGAPPLW